MAERVILVCAQGTFTAEEAGPRSAPADMPGVVGIFLGGCVERGVGRISDRPLICQESAHAHINGPYVGWVCFQMPSDLNNKHLRMHELAHILTGQGHTDAWRRKMIELGQTIPERYKKKPRATKRT